MSLSPGWIWGEDKNPKGDKGWDWDKGKGKGEGEGEGEGMYEGKGLERLTEWTGLCHSKSWMEMRWQQHLAWM
jgi:hypothetical protein